MSKVPTPTRLLFVCLGNICRSPTAEAVMARLLDDAGLADAIDIDSAGTGSWHVGALADPRSREAASRRGITIESRARRVVPEDFEQFDYILAMDQSNHDNLLAMAPSPEARRRVYLFRSFDPNSDSYAEVPDPYRGGDEGFEHVLDLCEAAARGLLSELKKNIELART